MHVLIFEQTVRNYFQLFQYCSLVLLIQLYYILHYSVYCKNYPNIWGQNILLLSKFGLVFLKEIICTNLLSH